jgi:hypothetical protein
MIYSLAVSVKAEQRQGLHYKSGGRESTSLFRSPRRMSRMILHFVKDYLQTVQNLEKSQPAGFFMHLRT